MPGVDPNRAIGRPVLQTRDASDTLQIMKQGKCQVANREPTPPGTVEVAVNTPRGSSSSSLKQATAVWQFADAMVLRW